MTEQQFEQLLIQHEKWLDNGASTVKSKCKELAKAAGEVW